MPHTQVAVIRKTWNKYAHSNFTLTREAYLLFSRSEKFLIFLLKSKANASLYFNTSTQRLALVSAFLRCRFSVLLFCPGARIVSILLAKLLLFFHICKYLCKNHSKK